MRRFHNFIVSLTVTSVMVFGTAIAAKDIPQAYRTMSQHCGAPARLLYGIALTESGRHIDGEILPWPWTINVNGQGHFFAHREAMVAALTQVMFSAQRQVDIGLMQLNLRYQHHRFRELDAMINPIDNLNAACEVLLEQYFGRCNMQWWCAVGAYHAPGHATRAQRYIERVRQWVERLH